MSSLTTTSLSSASSRLSNKARAGADGIDHVLSDRSSETVKTEVDKLSLLSTSLRQLEHHAIHVCRQLAGHSADSDTCEGLSRGLDATLTAVLPQCEHAVAFVAKQISRLDKNTPRQQINVAAISRFEASVQATTGLWLMLRQLLATGKEDARASLLQNAEMQQTVARAQEAANDIGREGEIVGDTSSSGAHSDMSRNPVKNDTSPGLQQTVGAELPPYSDAAASSAPMTAPARVEDDRKVDGNPGGFLDTLSHSFKALTSVMRFKPEPFVVPLCEAAAQGNVLQIQGLLDAGANINGHNEAGLTALICAVRAGQIGAARYLLGAGANMGISSSGRKGRPPLFHAVDVQSKPALDLLLANGATMVGSDSWFLDLLTGNASPDWIAVLLSRGANVHARDSSGRVAIALTIQNRKKKEDADEVVATLLAHGADANARDLVGTPLLHLCLQQGRDDLMMLLIEKGANVNSSDLYGNSLIIEALKRSDVELVKTLIAKGVDVNSTDMYGNPVIGNLMTHASLSVTSKESLLELLAQRGVRCGVTDSWAVTPLDYAVASVASKSGPLTKSELRIVELLISHGSDVNQRLTKQTGYPSLLTFAIDRQDWALFRVALANGANPNHADTKGRTPLLMTLQYGTAEFVALLLTKGADVNQPGQVTPADMARATRDPNVMRLLGVPVSEPLHASRNDNRGSPAVQGPASLPSTLQTGIQREDVDLPPRYEDNLALATH